MPEFMFVLPDLPIDVAYVRPLSSPFVDSTHRLLQLEDHEHKIYCLKILHNVQSPFWAAMRQIFDVDLELQLGSYEEIYCQLAQLSPLSIPDFIAAHSVADHSPAFVLTRWLSGTSVQSKQVSNEMIEQLSRHVASLHQRQQSTWGSFFSAHKDMSEWSEAVRGWLLPFFPDDVDVFTFSCMSRTSVPMMLDLRWDQFLATDNALSALVDLDAFIYAPIELDFVLMEYVLSAEQLKIWSEGYVCAGGCLPMVADVRAIYRKLLWSMQIHGEVPLSQWLAHPCYFA